MITGKLNLKFEPGIAGLLATVCIALAVLVTSCGGGGGGSAVANAAATPGFSESSPTVTFGNQVVGTTSAVHTDTLTNVGTSTLNISSVQVTGPNAGDFSESNTCGSTLAPSAQCTVSVTLTPSATGARTASVVFTDNAAGSPHTVSLSGTGTAAGVALSASTLTFGNQTQGAASSAQSVTLTNNSAQPLTITSIAVTGTNAAAFSEANTCGTSISASSSCTIFVTFNPTATGTLTATLTITDSASATPEDISLSGTGEPPSATFSPTSLSFGTQTLGKTSSAQLTTLTNTSNLALSVGSLAVLGSNASDFAETNNCGTSLAAGANCTISVTFTPAVSGSLTADVGLSSNSSGVGTVSLNGTGAGPAASLSQTSITFGSQVVGSTSAVQTITLNNSGTAALSISGVALTGANSADFAQTNTCGSSVAAGASCSISVTFKPVAAGALAGSVTVTDNAAGSTQSVSLSGTGVNAVAAASLSQTSISFGNQAVGYTSPAQTISLTNSGNTALTISSIALSGTNPGDFAQTNTCGSSVAAGASCTISVTFKPPATGSLTAAVTLTDNAPGNTQSISLSGTGVTTAAAASLSPTGLTFGSQNVGSTSAAQTITLSNTGNAALSISSIALTGADPADFAETNTCGSSVAIGANCTISVTFKPPAAGSLTAAVTLTDNASSGTQSVSLSGTGASTAPSASLSPSSLAFGSQTVGSTSTAQTITLSNTGNGALSISSIALTGADPGDFAQTNTCGSSVAAGANCTISVTFKPPAAGTLTAAVTLTDNASSGTQSVSLSGTGASTAPSASLSPTNLTFGSQTVGSTSAAQTITLSNTGNASLSLSSIALTGTDPGDFAQTNTCGSSVAAGANCTISVTFKPPATGSLTAAVTLTDNASSGTQSVSLSGTGASTAPSASLSATSLSFGNEAVDVTSSSQVITLSNTGGASLSTSGMAFTGADASDFAESDTCGSSVAAGGKCTIAVQFTPAATGARTGALSINDNASGSPQSVALSGSGTHDVMLSWAASTTTGIAGYYVYRGTTSGGESSTPLNSTPISGTSFADESVTAGTTYYYLVKTVASDDVTQSASSNEASVSVP